MVSHADDEIHTSLAPFSVVHPKKSWSFDNNENQRLDDGKSSREYRQGSELPQSVLGPPNAHSCVCRCTSLRVSKRVILNVNAEMCEADLRCLVEPC